MPETEKINTDSSDYLLRDENDKFTIGEVVEEYRYLNEEFINLMNLLLYIFDKMYIFRSIPTH